MQAMHLTIKFAYLDPSGHTKHFQEVCGRGLGSMLDWTDSPEVVGA